MKRTQSIPLAIEVRAPKKSKMKSARKSTFRVPSGARASTGFPKMLRIRHRYISQNKITSTSGALTTYNFRANGMFDPDSTGGGHQPLYFDQLAALYDHFCVTASKITVRCVPAVTNTAPGAVGIFVNDDTSVVPTTWYGCAEQNSSVYKMVGAGAGAAEAVLAKKWDVRKYFATRGPGDPELQGTASADPTEQSVFTIFAQTADGTATTTDYYIVVTVEYDAIWTELRDVATS